MRTILLPVLAVSSVVSFLASAQPEQTMITGRSKLQAVHESSYTGPMRTTLVRENKYPSRYHGDASLYFERDEMDQNERNSLGVEARYGAWENLTVGAGVPFIDSDFNGDSNRGLGDVELFADLVAYQDIFRYPFVIPHLSVSLPTGDEDKGLGSGDTAVALGLSVGTKVYDQLTYILDFSYEFNGAPASYDSDNRYSISGALVWDISDRLALLVEGRIYEKNAFDDNPVQYQAGLAYRISRDVQVAGYGGRYEEDTAVDNQYDLAGLRLTVNF